MDGIDLLRSLYLGDRACKRIDIRGWDEVVAIQVNLISRLRAGSSTWDYSTDGDIENGWIVFRGVTELNFSGSGGVPNDAITIDNVTKHTDMSGIDHICAEISVACVAAVDRATCTSMRIVARSAHLESADGLEVVTPRGG